MAEANHRRDPADARVRRDLSVSLNKRGNAYYLMQDAASAASDYRRGLEQAEAILAADPGDSLARRDVSIDGNRLGDASVALGEFDSARAAYHRALELREGLAASNPRDARAQLDLVLTQYDLAELALEEFRPDEALPWFERAIAVINRLEADGTLPKGEGYESRRDYFKTRAEFCRLSDPERLNLGLVAKFPAFFRPRLLAPRVVALARSGRESLAASAALELADVARLGDLESTKLTARALSLTLATLPLGPTRDRLASRAFELLDRAWTLEAFTKPTGRAWLDRAQDLEPIRDREAFRSLRLDAAFPTNPFAR
jgi:tetratricopeptide (TPR) repeat protein